jgi:hypothetical protein
MNQNHEKAKILIPPPAAFAGGKPGRIAAG